MASDIRFFGWAAGAKADFSPKPFGGRGAVFDRDACLDYRYEIDPEAAEAARLAELREREDECWQFCDEEERPDAGANASPSGTEGTDMRRLGLLLCLVAYAAAVSAASVTTTVVMTATENWATGEWTTYSSDDQGRLYYGGAKRGYPALSRTNGGVVCLSPHMNGEPFYGIRDYAFENSEKMTEIHVPEEIVDIAPNAFYGCTNVSKIVVGCRTAPCETHGETWRVLCKKPNRDVDGLAKHYCLDCMKVVETEVVPATGFVYNGGPFTNQLENTYLVFGVVDGNAYLSSYTYDPCIDVNTEGRIVIPETVRVGDYDYAVKTVGDFAFYQCAKITEVVIPKTVTKLVYYTFDRCPNLKRVIFEGDAPAVSQHVFEGYGMKAFVRYGTTGWGDVPGLWEGISVDWIAPPQPIDLNAARHGAFVEIAGWNFASGGWQSGKPSDFGLVGSDTDEITWTRHQPYLGDNHAYVKIDAVGDVRFPFSADLDTDDVEITFMAKHAVDDQGLLRAIVRRDPVLVMGVAGLFTVSAVLDEEDGAIVPHLVIQSDRTYQTKIPVSGWGDYRIVLEKDSFRLYLDGCPIAHDGVSSFPYATGRADRKIDGFCVRGYGSVDEVYVRRAMRGIVIDASAEVAWGPEASVPTVRITDPYRDELVEGVDYVISCRDNAQVGTAHLTITGIGNFTGTVERTFQVVRVNELVRDPMGGLWRWTKTREMPFEYDGTPASVGLWISDEVTESDVKLVGTTNAVNAGTYTATATGQLRRIVPGVYSDTVYYTDVNESLSWQITRRSILGDDIEFTFEATNFWATGGNIYVPKPTRVYDRKLDHELKETSEWRRTTVIARVTAGTYPFAIAGNGNYTGTKRLYWSIIDPAATTAVAGVVIPNAWVREKGIPIGNGIVGALAAPTGKFTASGAELSVWEEYVAGTDPNDPQSQFRTSVEIVNGKPVVTYDPDLGSDRRYRIYGSDDLMTWSEVSSSELASKRFFKVTVEMK